MHVKCVVQADVTAVVRSVTSGTTGPARALVFNRMMTNGMDYTFQQPKFRNFMLSVKTCFILASGDKDVLGFAVELHWYLPPRVLWSSKNAPGTGAMIYFII